MTVTTSKANINPVVAVLESRERTSAFFALSAKIRKKEKEEKNQEKREKDKEKRKRKKGKREKDKE